MNVEFIRATSIDHVLLSKLSEQTFLESHGNSASKEDLATFTNKSYNKKTYVEELNNPNNIYYLLYVNQQIAGYSKIVLNTPNQNIVQQNITKLDRIYLLKKFYGLQLGEKLLHLNISIAKKKQQKGLWLAVWVDNLRGFNFYKKMGFKIVGNYDFQISETHSNPNHIMHLEL